MKSLKPKGITLIALIMTIIVMLILVAVTVNYGIKSGLIGKAKEAKKAQEIAQEKEKVELAVQTAKLNSENFELTTKKLEEALQKEFREDYVTLTGNNDDGWNYQGKFETYYIAKDGHITIENETNYKIYGNNLLPEEYQQVEYIESTGMQWIDTGITFDNNTVVSGEFEFTKDNISQSLIGIDTDYDNKGTFNLSIRDYSRLNLKVNYENDVYAAPVLGKHTFIAQGKNKGGTIRIDNVEAISGDVSSERSIYLFATNSDKFGPCWKSNARIYSIIIYKNGVKVYNAVPSYRKSDNVIGMYDTVEGKFYTNQGDGEFLKGKAIMGVGDRNEDQYIIPLEIATHSGIQTINITLDNPLRKVGDVADYLDLKNRKVVRYIGKDGKVLKEAVEGMVEIKNIPDIKDITLISVDTQIKPSKISKSGKFEKLLPEEYQQVEYIESTGGQYIDTLYSIQTNYAYFDIKTMWIGGSALGTIIGQGRDSYIEQWFQVGYANKATKNWEDKIALDIGKNQAYKILFNYDNKLYINDKQYSLNYDISDLNLNTVSIFALKYLSKDGESVTFENKAIARIYYAKIFDYEEKKIVRNFIPCYSKTEVIDANGKTRPARTIGLYDIVEGKFYTNQGAGEFLKGNDVI